MRNPHKFVALWMLFFAAATYAQNDSSVLSLSEALALGDKNNLAVQVGNQNKQSAQNDLQNAQSSLYPSLTFTSDLSRVGPNFRGDPYLNAASRGSYQTKWSNVLGARWTLFDGMASWTSIDARKKQLGATTAHNDLLIAQLHLQITLTYYDIAQQQSLYALRQQALQVSQERLRIAQAKRTMGAATLLEEQQAQLDRNADSSVVLHQILILSQSKQQLNWLLVRAYDSPLQVDTLLAIDTSLVREALWKQVQDNSPALREGRLRVQVAQTESKTAQATLFPIVQAYANYNFLDQFDNPSTPTEAHNQGLLFGLNLSIPVFEGGRSSIRLSNAKISVQQATLQQQQLENQLQHDFNEAFNSYEQSLCTWKLEVENDSLAATALELAMGQFKIGALSSLDLRRVQESRATAGTNLYSARFQAKSAELALRYLAGL